MLENFTAARRSDQPHVVKQKPEIVVHEFRENSRRAHTEDVYVSRAENEVNSLCECRAVYPFKSGLYFFRVCRENVVDNVVLVHPVVRGVHSLYGGQTDTHRIANLRLKLGIAVESHLVCESYDRGFRHSDLVSHSAGSHVSRPVVVVNYKFRYPLLSLRQLWHSFFNMCDKIISRTVHYTFPRCN